MDFSKIEAIKTAGFSGFKSMSELSLNSSSIPASKGAYLVLNLSSQPPEYLLVGTGGFFKDKNPNLPIERLRKQWVEKSLVVYIGKAGREGSNATLRSRLKQYFRFGQGKNIGHWGGRCIWQLKNSPELIVCWKPLPIEDPRAYEQELIKDFVNQYGTRPYANLAD